MLPLYKYTENTYDKESILYKDFLTTDKATLKTLHRAKKCCMSGSHIIWLEGAAGTGKQHLSQIIMREHSRYHADDVYTHINLLVDQHTINLESKLTSEFQQHSAIIIKLHPKITAKQLIQLHIILSKCLNNNQQGKPLILFISYPIKEYEEEAAENINMMKQLFISNYYEFITLKPLHYRKDDIAVYIRHFTRFFAYACFQTKVPELTEAAIEQIKEYEWANNVRDMQTLSLLICQYKPGSILTIEEIQNILLLMQQASELNKHNSHLQQWLPLLTHAGTFRELQSIEKDVIQKACNYYKGCKTSAAKDLGLGRTTLYRKLKE